MISYDFCISVLLSAISILIWVEKLAYHGGQTLSAVIFIHGLVAGFWANIDHAGKAKRLLWLSGVLLPVLFSYLIAEAKVKNDLILEMGTPCSAQPGWERLWAGPAISPILVDLAGMPVFETTRLLHHCPHLGIVFQLFLTTDDFSSLAALSWLSQLALTLETCAKVGQLPALQGATVWLGGAPGAPWNAHAVRCCWLFLLHIKYISMRRCFQLCFCNFCSEGRSGKLYFATLGLWAICAGDSNSSGPAAHHLQKCQRAWLRGARSMFSIVFHSFSIVSLSCDETQRFVLCFAFSFGVLSGHSWTWWTHESPPCWHTPWCPCKLMTDPINVINNIIS